MQLSSIIGRCRAFVATPLGLAFAVLAGSIATGLISHLWLGRYAASSFIWMPSGLALGAFLLGGYRIWPAVALSALIVGAFTTGSAAATVAVAAIRTIEPLLTAYLVNRFAGGRHALLNPRGSIRLSCIVLGSVTLTGAAVAATWTGLGLAVDGASFGLMWLAQAFSGAAAMMVLAPPMVLFSRGRPNFGVEQVVEGAVAFGVIALTALIGFYGSPVELRWFPVELLLLPMLLWPALRLGRRATAITLVMVAVIVIGGTLDSHGPFIRSTPIVSLTIVHIFLVSSASLTLALAALSSDYEVAEAQLRELVVTDPLTGLPNYRRLVEVLDGEIGRAGKLGREFAVIFLDMDDLKGINDALGHLAGSRAVCRLAETLRAALRDADTAARYGGDEFVAVLPDTDATGAALVLARFREQLAADTAQPPLSVSAGVAVYPRDGKTPTTLLATADRALYANKAQKRRRRGAVVDLQRWTSAS